MAISFETETCVYSHDDDISTCDTDLGRMVAVVLPVIPAVRCKEMSSPAYDDSEGYDNRFPPPLHFPAQCISDNSGPQKIPRDA